MDQLIWEIPGILVIWSKLFERCLTFVWRLIIDPQNTLNCQANRQALHSSQCTLQAVMVTVFSPKRDLNFQKTAATCNSYGTRTARWPAKCWWRQWWFYQNKFSKAKIKDSKVDLKKIWYVRVHQHFTDCFTVNFKSYLLMGTFTYHNLWYAGDLQKSKYHE